MKKPEFVVFHLELPKGILILKEVRSPSSKTDTGVEKRSAATKESHSSGQKAVSVAGATA